MLYFGVSNFFHPFPRTGVTGKKLGASNIWSIQGNFKVFFTSSISTKNKFQLVDFTKVVFVTVQISNEDKKTSSPVFLST